MRTVNVDLGERSYSIHIGLSNLDQIGTYLEKFSLTKQVFVITDNTVNSFYNERIRSLLTNSNIQHEIISVPPGEPSKSLQTMDEIFTQLINFRATRQATIVALGGGVVGDLAGFVAASYMRGVKYVQVPTTLLSQVDSSVGGKTGVNHRLGKNLIGAFYQPEFVLMDPAVLSTLPEQQIKAGLAEVIKYSYIWDDQFFDLLNDRIFDLITLNDNDLLENILEKCCQIKAEVVAKDEKESGLRAILNFGHTIGHALEAITGYNALLHGEAVLLGMKGAIHLSLLEGKITQLIATKSLELIEKLDPPKLADLSIQDVLNAMQRDKKRSDKGQLWVLLNKIGQVELTRDVKPENVNKAIEFVLKD